jgi:hypothetical protein
MVGIATPQNGPQPGDVIHTEHNPPPHVKDIKVVLAYHTISQHYQVIEITETVYWKPGEWVTVDTMRQVDMNPQWSTRMVKFDLLGFFGSMIGLGAQAGIHMAVP